VNQPPKTPNTCDKCGGQDLYQRPDDEAGAIKTRLVVYDESTKPLKKYYLGQGLLSEVDGTGEVTEISERILAVTKQ
jgi:adenylate kinase